MAQRIRPLTPGELSPDQSALYAAITGGPRARGPQHFALTSDDGSLRGPFDVMLRSPAVGTAPAGARRRDPLPNRIHGPDAGACDPARRGALGQRVRA